jgi:hypothetical protein
MNELKRTNKEINEQYDRAADALNEGSKYPGMSYEDGVKTTLDWILGNIDDKPMED